MATIPLDYRDRPTQDSVSNAAVAPSAQVLGAEAVSWHPAQPRVAPYQIVKQWSFMDTKRWFDSHCPVYNEAHCMFHALRDTYHGSWERDYVSAWRDVYLRALKRDDFDVLGVDALVRGRLWLFEGSRVLPCSRRGLSSHVIM